MSLIDQCNELDASLEQLDSVRRGASDGAAIDKRYEQWHGHLTALQNARDRAAWLEVEEAQLADYSVKLAHATELAAQAARTLAATSDIGVLTHEDLWARLLKTSESAGEILSVHIAQRWAEEKAAFSTLTPAHQLEATASPLPQNSEHLRHYREAYSNASRLANLNAPKTSTDRTSLRAAIQQCVDAASKVRFDAPEDVAAFFRAVNSGGALMSLVTPTVLQWLTENDQLQRYVVRGVLK